MRALPVLLGLLVLFAGIVTFVRSRPPTLAPPQRVTLEPLPTPPFRAVLIQQADGEVRTRDAGLSAAENAPARLAATLAALRAWLREEALWPEQLGAPQVFWLGEGRAALDFPLTGTPVMSVAAEVRLLSSIRRTAVRQGAPEVYILVNGRVPPTFLGQVTLTDTLEE